MPPEITRLVQTFLKDPVRIEVAKQATTAKTITQRYCFCPDSEDWAKRDLLRNLIRSQKVKNAIIFCNRKRDVAVLHKSLVKHGFNAGALHGDMDQQSRTETLDKFRAGDLMLLAASDVAARGLDIPDVSHVFNFDLPWHSEDYVHRIGRTGRAGREGAAFSIVTRDDLKLLKDIQKITGDTPVWLGDEPSAEDHEEGGKRRRGRGGKPPARASGHSGERQGGERRERNAQPRPNRDRHETAERNGHSEQRAEKPRQQREDRPRQRPDQRPQKHPDQLADAPRQEQRPAERREPPRQQTRPQQPAGHPAEGSRSAESRRPPAKPAAPAPAGGFAENVPAFLRRPPRSAKIGTE